MSFPAYGSTSAAGSQEQRRSGPIFETRWSAALSRINQPAHPEKGVHVGGTQTQPDRHNKTPRKHRRLREVARFWYGLLDLTFLGDCLCLSAADLLFPSPLRVTIWHQTRLSSAAACQSHADRISATRRGGINFSLRTSWEWELASFQCCKVLTILYQPFFVLTRAYLAVRNFFIWRAITHDSFSAMRLSLVANSLWIMKST